MSKLIAPMVAALAAAATCAMAAPPPAGLDDVGVRAWLKEHIKTEGWTLIAADGMAVVLGGPDGVFKLGDGTLATQIRHEYYRPVRLGDMDTQSNLQSWEVDCKASRIRVVQMAIYADSNLQGASQARSLPNSAWADVDPASTRARTLKRICEAPTTGKRLN